MRPASPFDRVITLTDRLQAATASRSVTPVREFFARTQATLDLIALHANDDPAIVRACAESREALAALLAAPSRQASAHLEDRLDALCTAAEHARGAWLAAAV